MSLGKRHGSAGIEKYDKNKGVKKTKLDGPDIPSSNFVPLTQKPKKQTKTILATQSMIFSLPNLPLKPQNPTQALHKMPLEEKYKEVLGPDIEELNKLYKRKKDQELLAERQKRKMPKVAEVKKEEEKVVPEERPKKVTQDESGRIRDEAGNILNVKPQNVSTLKVNINKAKEERMRDMFKHYKGIGFMKTKIFDNHITSKSALKREKKKMNAFHFIEKGTIVRKADVIRKKKGEGEDGEEQKAAEGDAVPVNTGVASKRISVKTKHHDPIPDVEWWDIPILCQGRKSYLPTEESANPESNTTNIENKNEISMTKIEQGNVEVLRKNLELLENTTITDDYLNKDKISNYIEHPIPFKTLTGGNVVLPMYLTKDERKKLRRQKRQEREKEKQDKIKLGLIEPPPPKLKLSNYMRILGDEAVADPTRVEQQVRKAMADRLQTHLERNASKKLTKDQKKEKMMRKLKRDSALECRVCVFRVEDLSNRKHKFKIDMNAQQLSLNGMCIISDKKNGLNLPSVVIIEGGPKAIKFYKNLMLRRIKWDQMFERKPKVGDVELETKEEAKEQTNERKNTCSLVWEGIVKDHSFNRWRVLDIKSELEARRALAERNAEHYWDNALNGPAIETNS